MKDRPLQGYTRDELKAKVASHEISVADYYAELDARGLPYA